MDRDEAANPQTRAADLAGWLLSVEVNGKCTEAVLALRDDSRLCFCHRVDERWAKAFGPDEIRASLAHRLLEAIQSFRLNTRHLELFFDDGSCWEWRCSAREQGP